VKWAKPLLIASAIISAISLIFVILFVGVHIPSFNMWFYYWQYSANDTYAVVGMTPYDLHAVTRHMIDYMVGRAPDLQIYTYVNGIWRPFFSELEIRHMIDVYELAMFSIHARNLFILLFIITLMPFILLRNKLKRAWRYLFRAWLIGAIATFGILAVLAVVIAIDWNHAWYIFHEIIFTNEMFFGNRYWLLDPSVDLLINIVPYPFFMAISIFIGAFFAAGLVLMIIAGTLFTKKKKPRKIAGIAIISIMAILLISASFTWFAAIVNVIGIIASVILSLIILIFVLVMSAKFRYYIKVIKLNLNTDWVYLVRASWLLGLVKATFANGEEPAVKIAGFSLNLGSKENEEEEVPPEEPDESEPDEDKSLEKAKKTVAARRKRAQSKEKASKLRAPLDLINEIGKDNIKLVLKSLFEMLKQIFNRLRPKTMRVRGKLGLEEPDQTGYAMAGASVIQALGLDIYLEASFDEKALELDIFAKGGFRLFQIARILIRFWFKPEVQRVYRIVRPKK